MTLQRPPYRRPLWRMLLLGFFFVLGFGLQPGMAAAEAGSVAVPLQVAAGTNLIHLAQEYCKHPEDWKHIARINRLSPPYIIYADSEIDVPMELLQLEYLSLQVVTVSGRATVQKTDGTHAVLQQGASVAPGETVVTGRESFVQLLFPNGVYTRVEPDSTLSVSYLFSLEDGKIKAEALLTRGEVVHSTLGKKLRFNDSMRTCTPVVITGIRGTEYRLKAEGGGATRVETLQGAVTVRSGARVLRLRADEGIRARQGGRLDAPQALPPPPVAAVASLYRTLPVKIQLPKRADVKTAHVRLSTDAEGQNTVYEHIAAAGAPLLVQNVPDGRYFAFFSVTDGRGFESREWAAQAMTVRTTPPAPMVSVPRNGSVQWGRTATLTWLESEQAVGYRVQVARDAAFRDMVDEKVQGASTYVSPDLAPGLYHGRVLAEAKDGFQSDYSPVVSWEQKEAPVMAGMESSTEAPPVLQWSAMGPGWLYELQAAKDKEFRKMLVAAKALGEPAYTFPDRLDPGRYYIRMRAIDSQGQVTPWTPSQTLTVKNPPRTLEGCLIGALVLAVILL